MLQSVAQSSNPHDRSNTDPPTILAHLSFDHLKRRPRWIFAALAAATIYAVMPAVHLQVFGVDRIVGAFVDFFSAHMGASVGGAAQAALREHIASRNPWVEATLVFALRVVEVLMAGALFNVGVMFLGVTAPPRQLLAIASVTSLTIAASRVVFFIAVTLALGLDRAVAVDWTLVGHASLDVFEGAGVATRTLLASFDVARVIGMVVSAAGLRTVQPALGWGGAVATAALWPVLWALLRAGLAALVGLPLM